MSWLNKTLSSSIGKKVLMAGTGLFLITFLVVHLSGNLQLLKEDGGESFNKYSHFMSSNPLIHFISYGLYFFIVLHTIVAVWLTIQNKKARPVGYAVTNNRSSFAVRSMMLLGSGILFFIIVHMADFWAKYKMGWIDYDFKIVTYEGVSYRDAYELVNHEFHELSHLIIYTIGMIVLAFHLNHGFASAFQSFGINHKKYTPTIKLLGLFFSIIVPLLFGIIPIYFYFFK
jgi:succinate dehydrogenase / fumarate reductase, cytochrome b subunit